MRVLIAGFGYVGSALGVRLAAAGHVVFGLRRRPAAPVQGVVPLAADLGDTAALRALPGPFDAVVYAAAPDGRDEAAYRRVYGTGIEAVLEAVRCERFLLTSSTSVYAQDDGEWVDEASATVPRSFAGRLVLEGEAIARAAHPAACAVRLGGIYGPGRTRLLAAAREGRLSYQLEPPRYTNRIFRDDAAGLLAHVLGVARLEPVYVGVDCEPASEESVYRWLAARVGGPAAFPSASPAEGSGKRASNRLALAAGYRFRFPTFRDGYAALAGGGGG